MAPTETLSGASPPRRWRLADFRGDGYDKGRGVAWQVSWVIAGSVFRSVFFPSRLRPAVLRAFGGRVGDGVLIRSGARIHWPWKLSVGDNCWIGVDAWLLNLEPIELGSDVCVSQGSMLCTGSHDRHSSSFEFDNGPIVVGDNCWIAARAVVLRGVRLGEGTIVGAGVILTESTSAGAMVLPPRPIVIPGK